MYLIIANLIDLPYIVSAVIAGIIVLAIAGISKYLFKKYNTQIIRDYQHVIIEIARECDNTLQ